MGGRKGRRKANGWGGSIHSSLPEHLLGARPGQGAGNRNTATQSSLLKNSPCSSRARRLLLSASHGWRPLGVCGAGQLFPQLPLERAPWRSQEVGDWKLRGSAEVEGGQWTWHLADPGSSLSVGSSGKPGGRVLTYKTVQHWSPVLQRGRPPREPLPPTHRLYLCFY